LPETSSVSNPAVIALRDAGDCVSDMERYAAMLAAQGFAVYVLRKPAAIA